MWRPFWIFNFKMAARRSGLTWRVLGSSENFLALRPYEIPERTFVPDLATCDRVQTPLYGHPLNTTSHHYYGGQFALIRTPRKYGHFLWRPLDPLSIRINGVWLYLKFKMYATKKKKKRVNVYSFCCSNQNRLGSLCHFLKLYITVEPRYNEPL